MDAAIQRAVLGAARRLAEGRPVNISDRSFWRDHGMPDLPTRQSILTRAAALEFGSQQAATGQWFGQISSIYSGSGFEPSEGSGGPVDTDKAHVHIRFSFEDDNGNITYRSWSGNYDWSAGLDEVYADLEAAIADMERSYGLSGGMIVSESVLIY